MSRQLLTLVIVLVMVTGIAVVIQNASKEPTASIRPVNLALVTGGSSPYWQMIANGARAAALDFNVNLQVLMPEHDEDIEAQTRLLLGIDTDTTDGIAVSPLDAEQQTRLLNRLSQHAEIVTFDSDAPYSTRLSYIGASNLAAGRRCAALVKEAIPQGGKVVVIVANLTKYNTQERKSGFEEELAKQSALSSESPAQYDVIEFLVDDGDVEDCERQLLELLAAHTDLSCIVGMNAYHGPLLVRLAQESKISDKIKLVTFDDDQATLQGIEDGVIFATVAQDPYHYGFESVRVLAAYSNMPESQLPIPGQQSTITISTESVRKENLAKYRKMLEELSRSPDADKS